MYNILRNMHYYGLQMTRDRSGIVTALPHFARPGRDWIHPENLASDEV